MPEILSAFLGKRMFAKYHTTKTGKINRKPGKYDENVLQIFAEGRVPAAFRPRFGNRVGRPDRKKRKTSDKITPFFKNGIAFSKKCGIFCDDLFFFLTN